MGTALCVQKLSGRITVAFVQPRGSPEEQGTPWACDVPRWKDQAPIIKQRTEKFPYILRLRWHVWP